MFREMRRKGQEIPEAEAWEILEKGTHGVLALSGDDGYPYALPISYAVHAGHLVFHSALSGHKIDAIRRSGRASFCVVGQDDVVPFEYTTRYRSVIVFGRLSIVEDEAYKRECIMALGRKYAPMDTEEHMAAYAEKEWPMFCMLDMEIDHISGKESGALMKERNRK